MLGLYLHIPFCSAICHYCNFNRGLFDGGAEGRVRRGAERGDSPRRATAPRRHGLFGGGTPSLLAPEDIGRLIAACRDSFTLAADAEISLETNPETVTRGAHGRLSRGRRQPSEHGRAVVPRRGAARGWAASTTPRASARRSRRRARPGFDNISLDLMMWLPRQTRRRTGCESVDGADRARARARRRSTCWSSTRMRRLQEDMARAGWSQAPDEDAAEMYLRGSRAARRGRLRAVRDLERRARRAASRATT